MDAATVRFLLVVLAIGVVLLGAGFAWTRGRERSAERRLAAPPERVVPGLAADAPAPAYVPAAVAESRRPVHRLSDDGRAEVQRLLQDAPVLRAGWASESFVTHPPTDLAIVDDARVAVLPEGLGSARELLALAPHAGGGGLVVVAATLPEELVATLAANAGAGLLRTVAVRYDDAAALAALAARLGTEPVTRADLQAGWVPTLGRVERWVSGRDASWAEVPPAT